MSFGLRLQGVGFALSLVPFVGLLLILSAERDERNVAGEVLA